jgi:two-component system cell cycle response regulator
MNRTGNESLGYDEFELIGQNVFDVLFLPEDREKEKEKFKEIITNMSDTPLSSEKKILKKNGEAIIVSWSKSLIYDSNGNIEALICSGKDITELKMKDELLLNLNEMKDIFTGVLNQGLMGPVTEIQDYVQALLEQETETENIAYVEKIMRNVSNMTETLKTASAYLDQQPEEKI